MIFPHVVVQFQSCKTILDVTDSRCAAGKAGAVNGGGGGLSEG